MRDLVNYLVRNLVEKPDDVQVTEVPGERARVYEVRVAGSDLGKLIGKQGRTIRSVRSLVSVAATRRGQRALVEVVEA